eukprot:12733-Heterococcus_DN1.PRE.5
MHSTTDAKLPSQLKAERAAQLQYTYARCVAAAMCKHHSKRSCFDLELRTAFALSTATTCTLCCCMYIARCNTVRMPD